MTEKHYFVRTCYRNDEGQLISPSSLAKKFIWPEEVGSVVTAPDWDPDETCGGGLHGLRPGDQNPGIWEQGSDAVWLVCSYDPETAIELSGKIKVPSCVVEYVVNETEGAPTLVPLWLKKHGVTEPIFRSSVVVGESKHAQVGDQGHALAGDWGTAIAGVQGTAIAGYGGFATVGVCGKAIVGAAGTAKADHLGQAISGNMGNSIVGRSGHAIAGVGGQAQAGVGGSIQISWFMKQSHPRIFIGYIGENGLEPNVAYKLDSDGKFVKVETPND